jgi:hypothetical protein
MSEEAPLDRMIEDLHDSLRQMERRESLQPSPSPARTHSASESLRSIQNCAPLGSSVGENALLSAP